VYLATSGKGPATTLTVDACSLDFGQTAGVPPGSSHEVRVRAHNAKGPGPWSAPVAANPDEALPKISLKAVATFVKARYNSRVLYRVLNAFETPGTVIVARDPKSTASVQQRVGNEQVATKWICTTFDVHWILFSVAKLRLTSGRDVIFIELDVGQLQAPVGAKKKTDVDIIDISDQDKAGKAGINGALARNFATAAGEILLEGQLPASATRAVYTLQQSTADIDIVKKLLAVKHTSRKEAGGAVTKFETWSEWRTAFLASEFRQPAAVTALLDALLT